jgi:hypothetical protein
MAKGRKTGGRKKGVKNKRTIEREMLKVGGTLPLQYMLKVMRDKKADNQRRDEMARAAAPYVHARRVPEDKTGNTVPTIVYNMPSLEAEERATPIEP